MRFARTRIPRPPTLASIVDALEAIQDATDDATRPSLAHPLVDAHVLKEVAIATTNTDVAHLLQRAPQGWIITRKRGAGDVYEATTQPDPTRFLRLVSSAAVTVDLMVF